jgi:hypothetical protein
MSRNFEIIERDDGSVLFRLPRNKGGPAFKLALILLVPIILFGAFGGGVIIALLLQHQHFPFFFYLFPGVFVLLALYVAICSAWLFFGHTTIRLNANRLRRTLWLGPVPLWASSCPVESIQRLAVVYWPDDETNDLVVSRPPQRAFTLVAKYPDDVVYDLAGELVQRLRTMNGNTELECYSESMAFTGERPVQPGRSRVQIEETDKGFILRIPPAGLLSPFLILFLFGMFWFVSIAFITFHAMTDMNPHPLMILFLAPFWLVAVGILWGALYLAYRRLEIEVRDGELAIRRIGLHGRRERLWPWGEVTAVAALREQRQRRTKEGSTYFIWVHLLRIYRTDGSTYDLEARYGMDHRTLPAEWESIATTLRSGLGVPAWPG